MRGLLVCEHEDAEEGAQSRPDAAEARAVETEVLEGQTARQLGLVGVVRLVELVRLVAWWGGGVVGLVAWWGWW